LLKVEAMIEGSMMMSGVAQIAKDPSSQIRAQVTPVMLDG
jgi:hypothetical protein